jgi:hypothetical protein
VLGCSSFDSFSFYEKSSVINNADKKPEQVLVGPRARSVISNDSLFRLVTRGVTPSNQLDI